LNAPIIDITQNSAIEDKVEHIEIPLKVTLTPPEAPGVLRKLSLLQRILFQEETVAYENAIKPLPGYAPHINLQLTPFIQTENYSSSTTYSQCCCLSKINFKTFGTSNNPNSDDSPREAKEEFGKGKTNFFHKNFLQIIRSSNCEKKNSF
jgi:hypothetical protein